MYRESHPPGQGSNRPLEMSFEFNPNRGSQLHQPPPRYPNFQQHEGGRTSWPPSLRSQFNGQSMTMDYRPPLDNNQSLPLCGPPVDPHEDGSYYMNMSSSSFHQPSSVAYSYPRNTNRGIGQSTRHSSVNPSLGLPFSSSTSITLAQGPQQQRQRPPMLSESESGLFGGCYVTPRSTGTGKCNIKTESETIDLCDSEESESDEPPPHSKKRVPSKDGEDILKRKALQDMSNESHRAGKVKKCPDDAAAEIVRPALSTTAADASTHVHCNATAEIVSAPSGDASSASAPSYPRWQPIMMCALDTTQK